VPEIQAIDLLTFIKMSISIAAPKQGTERHCGATFRRLADCADARSGLAGNAVWILILAIFYALRSKPG